MTYSTNTIFKIGAILLLLLLASLACTNQPKKSVAKKSKKPNIIYLMADDLTTQAISAYGGIYKDIAPTPNMDRIATEGMLFEDVLCSNAICGPSRAAILTGNLSHVNGYYKNERGGQFNTEKWTFPQAFQKHGYQTALFGKWHLGTDPVGFDDYKFHAAAGQQGHYWNPVYNHNGEKVTETGYATNLSTNFALNWLENDRQANDPFLMLLQFKAPHRPWQPDTPYEQLWENIEMPYPATFEDDYKGRELTAGDTEMTMDYFHRRDMKLTRPDNIRDRKDIVKWDFFGAKNGEIVQPAGMSKAEGKKWRYQNYIKDYLACVKSVDDNIGRVLNYLDKNGLAKNTMIVLTSDQGFYLGDHGFFDKRFIYEESLRMPFMIKFPKQVKAGSINTDVISNIDFAPMLLEVANIETTAPMQGKSFATMLQGETPQGWRQSMYYHYYEFPFWHHVQPHYGIRDERYTLAHFYYNIDQWELYDRAKDPQQMNNIINDPAYQETVITLKKELKGLLQHYDNDLSLAAFRTISDTDFGSIMQGEKAGEHEDVEAILNGKKKGGN